MNKKLMAVAVAGALAAPAAAFAQASNVQIYGRAHLGIDNYQATGATAGSAADFRARNRVYDQGSRLGFTGKESLGNGMRAIFLMESGVNIDTGTTVGQNQAAISPATGNSNRDAGTLSSRVGYVGLEGDSWGQLTFGKNNVWWGSSTIDQFGANYVNVSPQFTSGIFGRGMSVGVSRVSNVMQYATPTWNGMNAVLSYSPSNALGQGQESSVAGANVNGKLYGFTVDGAFGPIKAGWDWTRNYANTSTVTGTQAYTTGNKARVGWTYAPGGQVMLVWVGSKVQDTGGIGGAAVADPAASSLQQSGIMIGVEHMIGNIQLLAQLGKVGNISGCSTASLCLNTNASTTLLAGRYLLSKRTAAYVSYNSIRNDTAYNLDFAGAAMGAVSGAISNGSDPRIWAFGILHNF